MNRKYTQRDYVLMMRRRTDAALAAVKKNKKDDLDREWESRQLLNQLLRERGWLVRLKPGDIGYYDDELLESILQKLPEE